MAGCVSSHAGDVVLHFLYALLLLDVKYFVILYCGRFFISIFPRDEDFASIVILLTKELLEKICFAFVKDVMFVEVVEAFHWAALCSLDFRENVPSLLVFLDLCLRFGAGVCFNFEV